MTRRNAAFLFCSATLVLLLFACIQVVRMARLDMRDCTFEQGSVTTSWRFVTFRSGGPGYHELQYAVALPGSPSKQMVTVPIWTWYVSSTYSAWHSRANIRVCGTPDHEQIAAIELNGVVLSTLNSIEGLRSRTLLLLGSAGIMGIGALYTCRRN